MTDLRTGGPNPASLLRRAVSLPAGPRSRAALAMAGYAGQGRFVLQCCLQCGNATYPPRDACPKCWGELAWRDQPAGAHVLSETTVRVAVEPFFRDRAPWRVGKIKLDAGPVAFVHLHGGVRAGDKVTIRLMLDRSGNVALFALPVDARLAMTEDRQYSEFTSSPRNRRILVTDALSDVGRSVAKAFEDAGAACVYLGSAVPPDRSEGEVSANGLRVGQLVHLDLADISSVTEASAQIGTQVDIVVNTASFVRAGGVVEGPLSDQVRAFDVNALSLSRIAQAFGPPLAHRMSEQSAAATAFVDIIPIHALSGWPQYAGLAASAAARLSLAQSLRSEMRKYGVRVATVFTGPIKGEWHHEVPAPKVRSSQVAKAVVKALEQGLEETCVGEVAADLMAKWREDPALTIREALRD